MGKKWYMSKTLWANAVAIIAIIAQGVTGKELIPVEAQGVILGLINVALRAVTKENVVWMLALVMLASVAVGPVGCASGKSNTAITTLRTTHITAREAAIAVKSLCDYSDEHPDARMISENDCQLAEQSWETYRTAESAAKDAIRGAVLLGRDPDTDPDVQAALSKFASASLDIVTVALKVKAITDGGN
jgi:hypothetical protein